MIETFAFSAVAFLGGFVVAKRVYGQSITSLQETIAKKDTVLKARIAQLKSFRRSQNVLKGAWVEVAAAMDMSDAQRQLLRMLSNLLPELAIPEDANASLEGRSRELTEQSALLSALVREIGDIRLMELWKKRSFVALHEMVKVLVGEGAKAANNSDFAGLEIIELSASRVGRR